ncbi:hypothetical protein B0H16DRAFT_1019051 [Mycena metata]|uniref:Uncharacterized protein n=1 Tax=Mycena metata TaxID=1033252 RepID=A0AAD7IH59_9AGAR|nr:hypothetical protein B0H16DRAFT_1019051 [Mycena metata]
MFDRETRMPSLTRDGRVSVLKLSTMWRLLGIRSFAIDQLKAYKIQNTAEGVLLGRKYRVAEWVRSSYNALVEKGLSLKDAEAIGWETATRIYAIREETFVKLLGEPYRMTTHDAELKVGLLFSEELQQAVSDSAEYVEEGRI